MSTNIDANSYSPAVYGAQARSVQGGQSVPAADALEAQSQQLSSLSPEQRAAYNSYSGYVLEDIDSVMAMQGCNLPGGVGGAQGIDAILAQLQMQQSLMMSQMLLIWLMLELMMRMQGQGLGGSLTDNPPMGQNQPDGDKTVDTPGEDRSDGRAVDTNGECKSPEDSKSSGKDSGAMTPVQAARVFVKYFDLLDTAAGKGRKDNVVEMADFEAVAKNPDAPTELRQAAAYIVRNPMMANAMDVGNRKGKVDGRFGLQDFVKFIEQHEGKDGYDTAPTGSAEAGKDSGTDESKEPAPDGTDEASEKPAPGESEESGESTAPGESEDAGEKPPVDETNSGDTSKVDEQKEKERLSAIDDAKAIHTAVDGLGTDEAALIKILSNRTNHQIELIKSAYRDIYKTDMVADIKGDTSGHFQEALALLLDGKRDESKTVDPVLVKQDLVAIWDARRVGITTRLDDKIITPIFMGRSKQHLAELAKAFEQEHGEPLADFIESRTSGDYETILLAQLPPR